MSKYKNKSIDVTLLEDIADQISQGVSIITLCDKYSISPLNFARAFEKYPLFAEMLVLSKRVASIIKVEGIEAMITSSETREEIARARIHADNIRWIASKDARDIYGEKMDVAITNTLDLSAVLQAANARVVPMLDHADKTRDVSPLIDHDYATGLEPVAKKGAFDDLL